MTPRIVAVIAAIAVAVLVLLGLPHGADQAVLLAVGVILAALAVVLP